MHLLDSRRLTGASMFLDLPGAVLDLAVADDEKTLLAEAWRLHARRLLEELDWPVQLATRPFEGGLSVALAAPRDGLYTATELNEAAWDAARDMIEGGQRQLLLRAARTLRSDYRDEERPRLQRLLDEAQRQGLSVQLDEDSVTLGSGCFGETHDLLEVPHPDDVEWRRIKSVPTALITGTNGKTTTVRLLAAIAKAAGKTAGVSSTDWLSMGDDLIAKDDYAGPSGARSVLRDKRCELAILETARGGLLRRGLAVERADVALITNIAADHLGDYGIETIEDLLDVKWSVTRALDEKGCLVLNAEDPLLMSRLDRAHAPVSLFSLSPKCQALADHVANGGVGFTLQRGRLVRLKGASVTPIVSARKIPVTHDGKARHNIANALAAAATADALNIPPDVIARGLVALRNEDNPGRANFYYVGGVTVLLDFAHNPAGLEALMPIIDAQDANRRVLITGQAGDRSDQDIRDFAEAIGQTVFDRVILKRMDGHARGRAFGEVARIMRDALLARGYTRRAIGNARTELDATRAALRWAKPGDLIVLLSHEKRDATRELLASLAAVEK